MLTCSSLWLPDWPWIEGHLLSESTNLIRRIPTISVSSIPRAPSLLFYFVRMGSGTSFPHMRELTGAKILNKAQMIYTGKSSGVDFLYKKSPGFSPRYISVTFFLYFFAFTFFFGSRNVSWVPSLLTALESKSARCRTFSHDIRKSEHIGPSVFR